MDLVEHRGVRRQSINNFTFEEEWFAKAASSTSYISDCQWSRSKHFIDIPFRPFMQRRTLGGYSVFNLPKFHSDLHFNVRCSDKTNE